MEEHNIAMDVNQDEGLIELTSNPMLGDGVHKTLDDEESEIKFENLEISDSYIDAAKNTRTMSSFLILNSMIGSGIFNQPYVFSQSGVGTGVILLTSASFFVWLGITAMIETGIQTSTYDFSSLGFVCLGQLGANAVDISIIVTGVGSIMSYIAIIGHLSTLLLASWGWTYAAERGIYLITSILIFVFVLPFCLYRNFGHFAFISLLSMGSVVCVIILLITAGPVISHNDITTTQFFEARAGGQLGSIIFALNCSANVFPTYKCIEDRYKNKSGWRKIAFFSVVIAYFAILTMGLGGYLIFGTQTDAIIVTNFKSHYADPFKILAIVHLMLYTPLDFVILRQSILKVTGVGQSGHLKSTVLHALCSTLILGGNLN